VTTRADVEAFRKLLLDTAATGAEFPAEDEWLMVTLTVCCHTAGCVRAEEPHQVQAGVNADGLWRVYCGHCTQKMSDVTEHLDE